MKLTDNGMISFKITDSKNSKIYSLGFKKLLLDLEKALGTKKIGNVEVNFVDKKNIRGLNLLHRGIDKETDVLSFELNQAGWMGKESLIGEIFICEEVCAEQANMHELETKEEVNFLFIHGILHVLGFDHENPADFDEMFGLQLKVFNSEKWNKIVKGYRKEYFG